MPPVSKCYLCIVIPLVVAGCSDGQDNLDSTLSTAQRLCDAAVFTTAAPVADPAIQEISGIIEATLPTAADFHPVSGVLGIRTYGSPWLWQVGRPSPSRRHCSRPPARRPPDWSSLAKH